MQKNKLFKAIHYTLKYLTRKALTINAVPLEKYGTFYGGWKVPTGYLNSNSICYFAGAGEDISFDVAIAQHFGCQVYIFDPTPRAKKHFDLMVMAIKSNSSFSPKQSNDYNYQLDFQKLDLLHFEEYGLWNKTTTLKFFAPANPEHVSHSAVNLQGTTTYFEAKVKQLAEVMQQLGHSKIDYLKLDIEGSEYAVLETVLNQKLPIGLLGIEFDEAYQPLDLFAFKRIYSMARRIKKAGYQLVDIDEHFNMTFLKK